MTHPDHHFPHPHGILQLQRWPRQRGETLRAWDGADRYLLEALQEEGGAVTRPLVLNDQCGALVLPLLAEGLAVSASGDSVISHQALLANAADNGVTLERLHWCWADQPLPGGADGVLLRVPKELSLLEWQLAALTASQAAGTPVWVAGMDKHLPRALLELLGRYLDDAHAGLGRHKARVFRGRIPAQPRPAPAAALITVPDTGWQLQVDAGVFSRQQLDIGARFFLEQVPAEVSGSICDLGCGNGVIGMMALQRNPQARVTFCDESALAVASARANVRRYFPDRATGFHHGNGLDGLEQQFDLILLNPPFHRGHAVDDSVARMLFRHARRHLNPGGRLRVIGNSHLDYGSVLRRQFSQVQQVARNNKFTIHDASL
jgi:23S rRNA (guanine1835-N2)-methyltransferase